MTGRNAAGQTVVIVGASVAGVSTARSLRDYGHSGPIVLVDTEVAMPYDKPALSKEVLTDNTASPPSLITDADVAALDIDLRLGSAAVGLDLSSRTVRTRSGAIGFDALVIATGSTPRRLPAFGADSGIHYLRTQGDALRLRSHLDERPRVVVIGGGFIGAEIAASARQRGLSVTIIEAAPRLMARLMPADVSEAIAALQHRNGVQIICNTTACGYRTDNDGAITGVELEDGRTIPAEAIVVGIGTVPNTAWLNASGLPIDDGLICGDDLAVEAGEGIYAAGDVVRWRTADGNTCRAEHWTSAHEQAAIVAQNLAAHDSPKRFSTTGYVWSDQFGTRIQHVGDYIDGLDVQQRPSVNGRGHVFTYHEGSRMVGATTFDAPLDMVKVRRALTA